MQTHQAHRLSGVLRRIGMLSGMDLGIRLLDVVATVLLARYLAPEGFGLLAFAMSFAVLFHLLQGFGMSVLATRDLARQPQEASRYLSNGLVVKAALAVVSLSLMWLVAWGMGLPVAKRLIVLLAGVVMVLEVTKSFVLSAFQAAQRMGTVALVSLAVRLGWVISTLAVITLRQGIVALLVARAFVTAMGFLASLGLVHARLQRWRWDVDRAFIVRLLRASLPFVFVRLFAVVHMDISMVMLSVMRGEVMAGWLASAQKFPRLFAFIPHGFFGAMLPELSQASSSPAELAETLRRCCKYVLLIGLPIAGGICVLAPQLVVLIYGSAYAAAVPALRLLIWAIPLVFLNSTVRAAIMAMNREREAGVFLCVGTVVNILTNLVAIARFGHVGAAATTVLTELVICGLQLRLLRRILPTLSLLGELRRLVIVTAAMMLVTWFGHLAPLAVAVAGSAATYFVGLRLLRVIGPEERSVLTGMFRLHN